MKNHYFFHAMFYYFKTRQTSNQNLRKLFTSFAFFLVVTTPDIFAQTPTRHTDIFSGSTGSSITNLYLDPTSQYIYFTAKSSTSDQEWYKIKVSDNTVTKISTDFSDYASGVIMRPTFRIDNNIFFAGAKAFNGANPDLEFNRFNLASETFQYQDINTASASSDSYGGFAADGNGDVYFLATDATGTHVYKWLKSDSTLAKFDNLSISNTWYPSQNAGIAYSNGYLYFESYQTNTGCPSSCLVNNNEPVRYKVSDDTYNTWDLNSGSNGSSARTIKLYSNSKIVFDARSGGAGGARQIYIMDPTIVADAPQKITNFAGTTSDGDIGGYLDDNSGKVYYYADDVDTRREIYVLDLAANSSTKLTNFDAASTFVVPQFIYNGFLYFTWRNGSNGSVKKIDLSNNTITDVVTGFSSAPTNFTKVGTDVYFQGSTTSNGSELWQVNLTTESSSRLTDINSGTLNSAVGKPLYVSSKIYFIATEASTGSELYSYPVSAPLPLNLLSFKGKELNRFAQLQWETSNELNTAEFTIEYAPDAINFFTIGTVAAAGTTNAKQYSFTHKNLVRGSNYYRIKMIDKDGSFTYSKVIEVTFTGDKNMAIIYPNPATSSLFADVESSALKPVEYTIFDVVGKAIQQGIINRRGFEIKINKLVKGNYTILLSNGQSAKFVKQ